MRLPLRATAATALALTTLAACSGGSDDADAGDAPPVSAAASCAQEVLAGLDTEQRIGQLMLVGVPIRENRDAVAWLEKYHLGGVLLTGTGATAIDPAAAATARLRDASPTDPDPFVAVTQVGGDDVTLEGDDFTELPAVDTQRGWDGTELRDTWTAVAGELSRAGITLTLSPVADTAVDDDSISADHAYGDDPADVAPTIDQVVRSLESEGVAAGLSAFPGQGRVTDDPTSSADASDDDLEIDDPQIAPFVTGIEAGADVVQVSAATFTQIDGERPATYSPAVITDLLRGIANFQGVVVSADLSGGDSVETLPIDERAAAFIGAGGDVVLSSDPSEAKPLLEGLTAAVTSSDELADQVDAAVERVLAAKAERGLVSCG